MTKMTLDTARKKLITAIGYGALTNELLPVHISMSMAKILLEVLDEAIHIERNSEPTVEL